MNRAVSIRSITRTQFDMYAPARSAIATTIMDEIEWFADDDGVVIGFIALDKTENDWSVCVLGPDGGGRFRAINASTGMTSRVEARSRLLLKMDNALASGGHPPSDDD